MARSVDSDETTRSEPSHLDLPCLQMYLYWSAVIERLLGNSKLRLYFNQHKAECVYITKSVSELIEYKQTEDH